VFGDGQVDIWIAFLLFYVLVFFGLLWLCLRCDGISCFCFAKCYFVVHLWHTVVNVDVFVLEFNFSSTLIILLISRTAGDLICSSHLLFILVAPNPSSSVVKAAQRFSSA
jgi:hypothetical protein